MPRMINAAGIESDKKLTNTSARKHLLTKLADSNIPDRPIVQISGHKNIASINSYAQMSRKRQNEISFPANLICSAVMPYSSADFPF
jgi:hypothetical protein